MGIINSIKDLFGGAGVQIGDALGGLAEIPGVQELQDQATALTDGVTETVPSDTEQGQTAGEDITNHLGM